MKQQKDYTKVIKVDELPPRKTPARASLLRFWNSFLYLLPLIVIVLLALVIIIGTFIFIAHFTSGLIASIVSNELQKVFIVGLFFLLRMLIRAALFPGSKYLMRKNLENNYAL